MQISTRCKLQTTSRSSKSAHTRIPILTYTVLQYAVFAIRPRRVSKTLRDFNNRPRFSSTMRILLPRLPQPLSSITSINLQQRRRAVSWKLYREETCRLKLSIRLMQITIAGAMVNNIKMRSCSSREICIMLCRHLLM